MDMEDKDHRLVEDFFDGQSGLADLFGQVARQQIEDNGFTERVMRNLPEGKAGEAHRLSLLWTWFCIVLGAGLFFVFGGVDLLKGVAAGLLHMLLTTLEVFVMTASTAEIPVNPWAVLLLVVFVVVYLPYQTVRKLSSVL